MATEGKWFASQAFACIALDQFFNSLPFCELLQLPYPTPRFSRFEIMATALAYSYAREQRLETVGGGRLRLRNQ